jgi:ElaB/YqjD/DUF883 family membrane-anchored ribosome-binding protein
MDANADARRDDVQTTLRNLIAASDRLVASLGEEGRQTYLDAVTVLQQHVRRAREELDDMQYAARREMRIAGRLIDRHVQANPWMAVGVAAAIGAAVGALVVALVSRR